ncbi:ATP-binding cassette domain-containing protein [Actinomadura parmotrematis]|uniref:UvrABC system protein A n=1 Tax=Actinomadura parmotrematis TaxID=2864039 RepID=A0ABS7G6Z6_9ACTN|nr:ATP-binding cassette domain-containing protein [Actinomadura parmotrematis]MBW8487403.1 ATP-binding cassette domain-containing protein [Actinomadura parmotrematis]
MEQRSITVKGARANNLADLDVEIPRGRLVVFAGVSGSGKSSLVFDTIAAEAGYQLNETFPPFARDRLPKWSRPEAAEIGGLSAVVVVDQRRLGGNARSTVGTVTDAWTYLRLVFSRLSEPHVGESNRFSFNDPAGMCPSCSGLGEVVVSAVDRFLDPDRSLAGGAVLPPGFGGGGYWYAKYADIGVFDTARPLREWTADERDALLHGGAALARLAARRSAAPPRDYEGVVERFERIHLRASGELSERKQEAVRRFTRSAPCPACGGDRLNEAARTATVRGRTIGDLAREEIGTLRRFAGALASARVAPAVAALAARLEALDAIGLGYLSLGRRAGTLSGGEAQRIKLVRHLGSSLTSMTYVLDEPTAGLHPADVGALVRLLGRLRDRGNSVLVVEHDPAVMAAADQVVEIGPGAGADGGRLVFQGSFAELRAAGTATARALARRPPVKAAPRPATGALTVANATRNNLRDVTVDVPTGVLTVLTGVAGSGKSSLAAELAQRHAATVVDQRPVAAHRRSTPLTYTGIAPAVRRLFAERNGVPAALFSANSAGACPECRGLGAVRTDLAFLGGQETVCEACGGRRFTPEVLAHTVDGLSIADVDALTCDEAARRLPAPGIARALGRLSAVGLGYLRLGQSLATLSGGECQRLKIAREPLDGGASGLYVLDEPTTGLHPADVAVLLGVLDALVDAGGTVVVVEHDPVVMRRADHLIDLGPGPGRHGGRMLYAGPPAAYTGHGTPTCAALAGDAVRAP